MKRLFDKKKGQKGSVELIVIGLIAALIIVLAIPLLKDIGTETQTNLQATKDAMTDANGGN